MTSRLKRKLNDLGVDTASSKLNESFCLIGTPLPPLEKSKDTGEFVPLWKQEVRDEKGRRRLHGAFTGGFSAGYFNTVGTKEGWTPSTFNSSRNDRAKKREARPEDFMDEEDLAELRESRKLVDEHEEIDFGGTAAEKRRLAGVSEEQDPITAALAASLAPPPKDSVGARILQKMGWRLGQGIGPRLTYAQRRAQDAGFHDPSKEVEGDEDDLEEAKKHTYPRNDIPVLVAPPRRDNFHGLGYVPERSLFESIGASAEREPTGPQISAGFGLGALNDAEDDDIDVYDGAPSLSTRNRVAFESSFGDDDHHISMGSGGKKRQGLIQGPRASSSIAQTFNDGTPVLKGFVLSDKPVSEDRWFPLPEIPPGWKPNPRSVWEQGGYNKENRPKAQDKATTGPQPARSHAQWMASQLSADERGSMLGETPLPATSRSVFDYLSKKDRERLQSIRAAQTEPSSAPSAGLPTSPAPAPTPSGIHIPHLHHSIAKAALGGFQPFITDPVKQSRYTAFLTLQASVLSDSTPAETHHLGFGPFPGQSTEEFNKELEDYAKAATVFKPLSGAMAGRFRSAVIVEVGPNVVEGLHQPTHATDDDDHAGADGLDAEKEKKEEDPKMGAVRLGMYGALTRETAPWQPAKLLCKRFGVKEPEVDTTAQAGAASAEFEFATGAARKEGAGGDAAASAMVLEAAGVDATSASGVGPGRAANMDEDEIDTQGKDILTYQRPGMDVFKAIFASDDEDSDDEDAEGDKDGGSAPAAAPMFNFLAPVPAKAESEAATEPTPIVAAPPPQDRPVNLATFKPTFVPRTEREARKDKGGDKKDKKRGKDKKAKAALMSFDVEDDGSIPSFGPQASKEKDKDRERKKKKRKDKRREEDDDYSMWVEKPAPEVVKSLPPAPSEVDPVERSAVDSDGQEAGPPRGRKRAIDFM